MWAVVPFKGSVAAKGRLASHLSADERHELVINMLDDVLYALTNSQLLKGVVVVSRASEAGGFARRHGVELYADRADDLSGAVVEAGHRSGRRHYLGPHRGPYRARGGWMRHGRPVRDV